MIVFLQLRRKTDNETVKEQQRNRRVQQLGERGNPVDRQWNEEVDSN